MRKLTPTSVAVASSSAPERSASKRADARSMMVAAVPLVEPGLLIASVTLRMAGSTVVARVSLSDGGRKLLRPLPSSNSCMMVMMSAGCNPEGPAFFSESFLRRPMMNPIRSSRGPRKPLLWGKEEAEGDGGGVRRRQCGAG